MGDTSGWDMSGRDTSGRDTCQGLEYPQKGKGQKLRSNIKIQGGTGNFQLSLPMAFGTSE